MPSLLICGALAFAAWAYGATEPWAWHFSQLLVFISVLGTLAEVSRDRRAVRDAIGSRASRRAIGLCAALCVFMVIQALNASHTFSPLDEGLYPRDHWSFLPRSTAAGLTYQSLFKFLTCVAATTVVRVSVRSRHQHYLLIGAMLLSGLCMGFLVIMQRLDHPHPPYPMTGMFVNANSYAAYANLLFPMALVMGRSAHLRALHRLQRSHPGYALYVVAAVLALSIVASGSRAGTAICAASALCWITTEALVAFRGSSRGWTFALSALIPFVVAVTLFLSLGEGRFQTEFQSATSVVTGLEGRRHLLLGTLAMLRDRWVAGFGAGTFAAAFPYYQPGALDGLFFRYAHNDWLEYPIELGVIGTTLLAAFVATLLRPAWQDWQDAVRTHRSRTRRYELMGITLGLGALGLHGILDFPLHIPAIALLACAWVGIAGQRTNRHW